jgi:bacterioferritin-associated ferredoxin
MYICSCNALNDRQVRAAIDAGVKNWMDVHAYHGVVPQCGSCGPEISAMLNPEKEVQGSPFFNDAMADV